MQLRVLSRKSSANEYFYHVFFVHEGGFVTCFRRSKISAPTLCDTNALFAAQTPDVFATTIKIFESQLLRNHFAQVLYSNLCRKQKHERILVVLGVIEKQTYKS